MTRRFKGESKTVGGGFGVVVSAQISGVKETAATLNKIGNRLFVAGMRRGMTKAARPVRTLAKGLAPKHMGTLRRSMDFKVKVGKEKAYMVVGARRRAGQELVTKGRYSKKSRMILPTKHAHFAEEGRRAFQGRMPVPSRGGGFRMVPVFIPGVPGTHFMRRAFDQGRALAEAAIVTAMRETAEKLAEKGATDGG